MNLSKSKVKHNIAEMNLCTMLKLWCIAWNLFTHIIAQRCVNVQNLKAFSIVVKLRKFATQWIIWRSLLALGKKIPKTY